MRIESQYWGYSRSRSYVVLKWQYFFSPAPLQGHLVILDIVLVVTIREAHDIDSYWLNNPQCTGQLPTTKTHLLPNLNSSWIDKFWSSSILLLSFAAALQVMPDNSACLLLFAQLDSKEWVVGQEWKWLFSVLLAPMPLCLCLEIFYTLRLRYWNKKKFLYLIFPDSSSEARNPQQIIPLNRSGVERNAGGYKID